MTRNILKSDFIKISLVFAINPIRHGVRQVAISWGGVQSARSLIGLSRDLIRLSQSVSDLPGLREACASKNFYRWVGVGGGWLEQVGLKLTQSPTMVGVEVGTELGN